MAKRTRRRSTTATKIVRVSAPPVRAAAPIIRVSAPRSSSAPVARRKRRTSTRRRSAVGSSIGSSVQSKLPVLVAAWTIGKLEQQGTLAKVPRVLGFGPIGSAAVIGWGAQHFGFLKGQWADKAVTALLTLAAYRHGSTGSVGEDVLGEDVLGGHPGGAVFFGQ